MGTDEVKEHPSPESTRCAKLWPTVMNAPCEMLKTKVPPVFPGKSPTSPLSVVPVFPSPKNALPSTPVTTVPPEPVPLKVLLSPTFWTSFLNGGSINNDNRHSNGFDVAASCATKKNGGGPSNKACCGNYPDRFPFKTIGGDRQCCGTRTYNALTLKCCDADSSTVKFNC